jgi:SET domain-containing protein
LGWKVDVHFKRSRIHGIGVFASERIPAGTRIWQVDPTMYIADRRTLPALPPEDLRYALLAGYLHRPSGRFVWYEDGMQFMNHGSGELANVGLDHWPQRLFDDHMVALRDIRPGEELREDYGFCLDGGLAPDHWMRPLYLGHAPEHYNFLLGLQRLPVAA